MANGFDVAAAKQAGYSDDEILQHLTQSRNFDVQGAMKAGYSKSDIIDHLSSATARASAPAALPSPNVSGLANQALRGTGIQVSAPNDPTKNVIQSPSAVGNFATSAAVGMMPSTQPRASAREILQAASQGKDISQFLPFGSPSSAKEMIAAPARQLGEGDVAGGLGSIGAETLKAYLLKKAGENLSSGQPPQIPTEEAGVFPNRVRAGNNLAKADSVVGDMPVNVGSAGNVALNIQDLAGRGGAMPKVVRDFLRRTTDPQQGPLTYSEARDFYSNATRLSADEFNRLTPVMQRQVTMFKNELGKSIGSTAEQGGVGPQYQAGMDEYASASRMQKRATLAGKLIQRAVPTLAAGYAAKKIIDGK